MLKKIQNLWGWLTGKKSEIRKTDCASSKPLAYLLSLGEKVDSSSQVCVFDGPYLLNIVDQIPDFSAEEAEKLTFWSIPRSEVEVLLNYPLQDKKSLETKCLILFEPEMGLGTLLSSRKEFSAEELRTLIQSQFAGFMNTLHGNPHDCLKFGEAELENFRACFSLLLSSNGLRCTGIGPFVEVNTSEAPAVVEIEQELREAVEPVQSTAEWTSLARQIHASGFPGNESDFLSGMAPIGEAYLNKQMSSKECARQIREFAEKTAEKAFDAVDDSYWNGLAIRLRLETDKTEQTFNDSSVSLSEPIQVKIPDSQRPQEGWIFKRHLELDRKLNHFLAEKLFFIREKLTQERMIAKDIRTATELRLLLKELELAEQLLKDVPKMDAENKELRADKKKIQEMVEIMNQAVTAVEYLEAAVKAPETMKRPQELQFVMEKLKKSLKARYLIR